ncbi:permease component of ABC-type sugar transporter [Sphaerochaeta pleomorpha str. Grapes]|uniref:Permease component of ABC-type sugar transporter n=1 Tax=Sphaerochaeta pleomorpha (strain ATCC BAA-1885 / DSM 22778 / Grapes) TaxID=158190 RepID=G8QSC1_SPHPG|nr:sugar ABC transporter permease [Sphaerochaeta pleomorpha]AEV30051.1 permease component of ABC-type sugar transporter [Sphaerochaeta pleomorpha str. Grapes]
MATERRLNKIGWFFILPVGLLLAVFLVYPIFYSFYLSFTSTKGIVSNFVGFKNYTRLFGDPMFYLALKNTFKILLLQVPIMLCLALVFASLLNNRKLKFKGFFRTALFLPSVTSLIAYTILFKMLFAYDGLVNHLLMFLNLVQKPLDWLGTPSLALFVLIVAMIWRWTGYNMIFYLSAMQNISGDLYEAASIDGASPTMSFFTITLPLLKPMILFTTVMSTIGTLQLFDEPMNLAQGGVTASTVGPNNCFLTLSVYIYNICFKYTPNFGYAATVSYAILIIIAILTYIQFRVSSDTNTTLLRKVRTRNAILSQGENK